MILSCPCFSSLCFLSLCYVGLFNFTILFFFLNLPCNLSSFILTLHCCLFLFPPPVLIIYFPSSTFPTIISFLNSPLPHCPPSFPSLPPPHSSIIRYPPARSGWILGTWVGTPRQRLLGQAAAPGAAVWVVQPSQLAASCQRPGFHRLWHQIHRAGQPWGLLGWLPERRSSGGPEGSLHYWLPEDGSRHRRRPPADQCGPGWLWGGPEAAASILQP